MSNMTGLLISLAGSLTLASQYQPRPEPPMPTDVMLPEALDPKHGQKVLQTLMPTKGTEK